MKNKSSRNLFYSITAFVLLSIFWSVLFDLFTDFKFNHLAKQLPWLLMTTLLSWSIVLVKLRKNEITDSNTQDLIRYIISFPVISLSNALIIKTFHFSFNINFLPFTIGSIIIACLTWILLRLNENMSFSFGRKIKIHSKLSDEQLNIIRQSLIDTRLEKHINLSRENNIHPAKHFDLLIISNAHDLDEEIINAHLSGTPIESYEYFLTSLSGKIAENNLKVSADYLSLKRLNPIVLFYQKLKNIIEPVIALIMGIILLPLLLIIALAIRLTSKGPAIFKQVRTGYTGKLFTLYKFRTMAIDAEKNGAQWWTPEDDRVTSIGKILRSIHFDELPQLLNIILGDMGFVGPRPEVPAFCNSLKKDIPNFHLRTLIKPGVTGWAQIKGGYANSVELSKKKLEFDLYYILNISPLLDLQIVVDTLTGNKVKTLNSKGIKNHESPKLVQPGGKNY